MTPKEFDEISGSYIQGDITTNMVFTNYRVDIDSTFFFPLGIHK